MRGQAQDQVGPLDLRLPVPALEGGIEPRRHRARQPRCRQERRGQHAGIRGAAPTRREAQPRAGRMEKERVPAAAEDHRRIAGILDAERDLHRGAEADGEARPPAPGEAFRRARLREFYPVRRRGQQRPGPLPQQPVDRRALRPPIHRHPPEAADAPGIQPVGPGRHDEGAGPAGIRIGAFRQRHQHVRAAPGEPGERAALGRQQAGRPVAARQPQHYARPKQSLGENPSRV